MAALTALVLLLIPASAVAADQDESEDSLNTIDIHHPAELAAALKRHPSHLQLDNALYYYTLMDDFRGTKMLLDAGARVNSRSFSFDGSPIENAACTGDVAMLRMLLDHGANPNRRGRYGWTPFVMAAIHGNVSALDVLAHWQSCKQCLRSDHGDTALHEAIRSRKAATVKYLLVHSRVKKDVKNDDGKTALDLAREALNESFPSPPYTAADRAEIQQMITLLQ